MTKLALPALRCALLASGILALLPLACSANQDSDLFNASGGSGGEGGQGGTGGTGWVTGGSGGNGGVNEGGIIGERVTLSGRVMAPSGAFPVSGALVFLTKEDLEPIPSGVYHYECDEMQGTPYALSKADGTWTIENAPVGTWKLVTRKGNFRRVREIEVATGMDPNVHEELTTLPGSRTPDGLDMTPSFAVVKTSPDLTYNLLAKFGMGQVNASGELIEGTESFHIYEDGGFSSYAHTSALFENENLKNYHMIFLPCYASSVGVPFVNNNLQKLRDYVSAGGRIYNSCTVSLWTEAPFPEYIDFYQDDATSRFDIGRRTGTAYATKGTMLDPDLAAWMSVVTGSDPNSIPFQNGYVTIDATQEVNDGHGLEKDGFVVKPYTWVRDNGTYAGSPLMVTYNYDLGKVFYSVYETSSKTAAITPQEYVLLYVILEVGVCANLPPEVK
jgi:hypothetical protein